MANGAAAGTYTVTISGLGAGQTWYFAPVLGASSGEAVSFALPAASALPAGDGSYGLWQTTAVAYDTPAMLALFADATLWQTATISNIVSGALAANCAVQNWYFTDPVTGRNFIWNSPKSNRLYAYKGYMYMEGGKTYTFGTRWANCISLSIDGAVVVSVENAYHTDGRGTYIPAETGWHAIEVRVARTTNTYGIDGGGTASWSSFGLAFNTDGYADSMPESNWTPLMDDGSGSLLRPSLPAYRTISLASSAAQNGTLTLSGTIGAGSAATAYVVYGARDLGTSGASGISGLSGVTVVSLGSVAASAAATQVSATVQGWGTGALVARLALVTDGAIAFTEPVAYAATALPKLSSAKVVDVSSGDEIVLGATLSSGSLPYTLRVYIGTDAASLSVAKTLLASAEGDVQATVTDLAYGGTYYWQLEVEDAAGRKAASEVASITLPQASRLYDSTIDGGSYATYNQFFNSQRTMTIGGTLSVLGAGETWVGLLYGTWYPSESSISSLQTALHDGDLYSIDSTGAFSVEKTFDWDQSVVFNWMVTNTTGTRSWSTWRPNNSSRTFVIVDAQTYTWNGGAEGEWTSAASWLDEGIWEDNAGYPRRGSGALFEAGTVAKVVVGDSTDTNGSDHRFSQLTLGEGADVTFAQKDGASTRLTLVAETDANPARTYGLDLGANSRLTLSGGSYYFANGSTLYRKSGSSDVSHMQNANVALCITNGADVILGNGSDNAWNMNGMAGCSLFIADSTVRLNGLVGISGSGSTMTVDNSSITQPFPNNDNNYIALRASGLDGAATLTIKGANPRLQVGSRVLADSGSATQYIDFVVPEGGWSVAPIQTSASNTTRTFGQGSKSGFSIALRIPADSPAALAGETLDVPLVKWPAGINATYVTLSSENLPHPATDTFYTTTATGATIVWAHLVGQIETDDPQIADFKQTSISGTGSTLTFTAIPGSGADGATIAATILDASGENAVPGASVSLSSSSLDAAGVVTATVSGLEAGAQYTLSVTVTDTGADSNSAIATFAFWSLGDYGAGTSGFATDSYADGPFTVWKFSDTATEGQTFTVTKPGYADILVVGGGGSGAGGEMRTSASTE